MSTKADRIRLLEELAELVAEHLKYTNVIAAELPPGHIVAEMLDLLNQLGFRYKKIMMRGL